MNRLRLAALAAALAALPANGEPRPLEAFRPAAEALMKAHNTGKEGAARGLFTPHMDAEFPPKKADQFFSEVLADFGKIVSLGEPEAAGENAAVYPARFEKGRLDIRIVLGENDRIAGFVFLPPAPTAKSDTELSTTYTLPFRGAWLVYWGGDTLEKNYHNKTPNQQFALDLVGVGPDGSSTRKGEGPGNEDYYAFGREILAPADGTVTDVIRGVRDNAPGSMNPYSALGNAVVLRHADEEFSVLAHLKQGSVRVEAGDEVRRGDVLAQCGNSGNSSEPHLHFHLQDKAVFQEGTGIRVGFAGAEKNEGGKFAPEAPLFPEKNDVIRPEP